MTERTREQDDDTVVRDGQTVRVRLSLMDSVQQAIARGGIAVHDAVPLHRPGYAALTDAQARQKQTFYDAYEKKLTGAWRQDAKLAQPSMHAATLANPNATHAEIMAAHGGAVTLSPEQMAKREKANAAYNQRISNAWKNNATAAG
jgi:hypothetical protein